MPTHSEGADLYEVISGLCEKYRESPSLNPVWLATEAMQIIAFDPSVHRLGYVGCHLQFRQIARAFCRNKFDPVKRADSAAIDDLFPDTLQERYPIRKKTQEEEAEYVRLEYLCDDDAGYNIGRMRRASLALQKHSDALEAYVLNRLRVA